MLFLLLPLLALLLVLPYVNIETAYVKGSKCQLESAMKGVRVSTAVVTE